MGVEHQFLRLAKIDAHEGHAAVRQLHVRRLHVSGSPWNVIVSWLQIPWGGG